jgi:putative selenate reductase
MDCARSARRLSEGEVEILYRRTVDEMPAHPDEIRDLLSEGITIRELVAPRRAVTTGGRLEAIECAVMTLGEPDDSGRPRPVEVPGGEITIALDTLIVAIGQKADLSVFSGSTVATSPGGYLEVDTESLETSIPRVYAGGDLREPGPSNIVEACGDGRRIARAILEREGLPTPILSPVAAPPLELPDLLRRRSHRDWRVEIPRTSGSDRSAFDEVVATLDRDVATIEAARCLDCDLLCSTCDGVCPNRAIATYFLSGPEATPSGPEPRPLVAKQAPQVAVIADLCNECGNCVTFCPTVGRPWRDKPRIYLNREDFETERDNAFMLLRINGLPGIQGRFRGTTRQLVMAAPSQPPEISDPNLAILHTLLRGMAESMAHLPVVEAESSWIIDPGDSL